MTSRMLAIPVTKSSRRSKPDRSPSEEPYRSDASEVPPEVLLGDTYLLCTLYELVVVSFTLRATNDLPDLGEEDVHTADGLAVVVELHVEALDFLRIVGDDDRALEVLFYKVALMFARQVGTPIDGGTRTYDQP